MAILELDGVSLYYSVNGEGIPIVFIHPPLITSETFKYQSEVLSEKYMVITFDLRGHGKSQYSHQPVTYPLIAKDIKRLFDHLGIDKAFIAGYSTGGSIALEFMLNYPDRALGGIEISGLSEVNDWYLEQQIKLAAGLSKNLTLPLLSLSISRGNSDNQETFRNLHHEALKGKANNIEQYYRYSLQYNCTEKLKTIHQPVLLIFGTKDKNFHHYAKLLHEYLPNNELKFIEKVEHQLPTQAAKVLNQLIDEFIQKHTKC